MKCELPKGWIIHPKDGLRRADDRQSRRSVAIHEAAHAVIGEIVGAPAQWLVIKSNVVGQTATAYRHRRGKVDPFARAVVLLAGHEAEVRLCGRPMHLLPRHDYETAQKLGLSDASINAIGWMTRRLVRREVKTIRRVARALLHTGRINRKQFLAALTED